MSEKYHTDKKDVMDLAKRNYRVLLHLYPYADKDGMKRLALQRAEQYLKQIKR